MASGYHFVTEWRVTATVDEVKAVLRDGPSLPQWWPSVYLSVDEVDPGGADDVGRTLDLHTKGWLPYTLRWTIRVTEPMTDQGFALSATGDLEGTGRWTFEPQGPGVLITYDWRVMASKPLLRRLSWLLKPAFSANHHWAMRKGEESLQLEIRRRRGEPDVPPPPPATFRRRR
ncbi:MAG: SRPBCC family protein [Acidimicrobiales bacterium]